MYFHHNTTEINTQFDDVNSSVTFISGTQNICDSVSWYCEDILKKTIFLFLFCARGAFCFKKKKEHLISR